MSYVNYISMIKDLDDTQLTECKFSNMEKEDLSSWTLDFYKGQVL